MLVSPLLSPCHIIPIRSCDGHDHAAPHRRHAHLQRGELQAAGAAGDRVRAPGRLAAPMSRVCRRTAWVSKHANSGTCWRRRTTRRALCRAPRTLLSARNPRRFADDAGGQLGVDMRDVMPWGRQYRVLLERCIKEQQRKWRTSLVQLVQSLMMAALIGGTCQHVCGGQLPGVWVRSHWLVPWAPSSSALAPSCVCLPTPPLRRRVLPDRHHPGQHGEAPARALLLLYQPGGVPGAAAAGELSWGACTSCVLPSATSLLRGTAAPDQRDISPCPPCAGHFRRAVGRQLLPCGAGAHAAGAPGGHTRHGLRCIACNDPCTAAAPWCLLSHASKHAHFCRALAGRHVLRLGIFPCQDHGRGGAVCAGTPRLLLCRLLDDWAAGRVDGRCRRGGAETRTDNVDTTRAVACQHRSASFALAPTLPNPVPTSTPHPHCDSPSPPSFSSSAASWCCARCVREHAG